MWYGSIKQTDKRKRQRERQREKEREEKRKRETLSHTQREYSFLLLDDVTPRVPSSFFKKGGG